MMAYDPWGAIPPIQNIVGGSTVSNPRTRGEEEALTVIVDEWGGAGAPVTAEAVQQRFETLAANRARKARRRTGMNRERLRDPAPAAGEHPEHYAAVRELLATV